MKELDDDIMHLKKYEEFIGKPVEIKETNDQIQITFLTKITIEIPQKICSKEEMQTMLGEKIGIIHIDNHTWRIRRINNL